MKWSVGMKIGAGFGIGLVILIIVGSVAYSGLNKMQETTDLVTHTYQVRENLGGLMQSLTDAETGQRGYLITGQEPFLKPYNDSALQVDGFIRQVGSLISDNPEQQKRLAEIQSLSQTRLESLRGTLDVAKEKGQEAARQVVMTNSGRVEMEQIRKLVGEMQDVESALLKARSEEAALSAQRATFTIFGGTLAAIVILSIVALIITRNISGPLREITATAERIASGDLSGDVSTTMRQDEVGVLAHAFARMSQSLRATANMATQISGGDLRVKVVPQSEKDVLGNAFASMVDNLQKLVSQTSEGINILSTSANQISTSTTQLASSAVETATAVTEATTTVEEVRQTAQLSSQKSKAVSDSAQKMAQISLSGTKSTEEAIGGINRIRQQMSAIAESMVRLSEQSQTIGQIVATVEDLAAQSNILAVNASIEAAKAGEHGKGFAVVAQEVRSLAEQSKQATNQVRTILTDIQKATSAAVMATEQGSKAVEAGVKQASDAGQSIQTLSNSVSESVQTATQIAASSQQQLIGVDQVASAMESIKQASTQNMTSAKQLEAAAHNLKGLGGRLKQIVDGYRV